MFHLPYIHYPLQLKMAMGLPPNFKEDFLESYLLHVIPIHGVIVRFTTDFPRCMIATVTRFGIGAMALVACRSFPSWFRLHFLLADDTEYIYRVYIPSCHIFPNTRSISRSFSGWFRLHFLLADDTE